jgi:hypothetical protein
MWASELMSKARHILAVVAVATALCADQAVAAAPAPAPHVAEMAGRLVDRLSQPFRRTLPSALKPINRYSPARIVAVTLCRPMSAISAARPEFSPFQFRLPPPTT